MLDLLDFKKELHFIYLKTNKLDFKDIKDTLRKENTVILVFNENENKFDATNNNLIVKI